MAHNIQRRDIQTGIQQAWHGKTNVVKAINEENAGILYDMVAVPISYQHGLTGAWTEADGKQIISLDDGLRIGKPVSKEYGVVTNRDIWKMLTESLAGTGHQLVSCGTVLDRSRAFVSVKLEDAFTAGGRVTEPTLNFLWGHSGEMAVTARTGFTVVVCHNTFQMAMGEGKDFRFVLPHRSGASLRLPQMGAAIEAYCGVKAEFAKAMEEASNTTVSRPQAQRIIIGTIADKRAECVTNAVAKVTNRMVNLFENGAGNGGETLADLFNAATDFYSHEAARGEDRWRQFENSEFGRGQDMKAAFYTAITDDKKRVEAYTRGEWLIEQTNN